MNNWPLWQALTADCGYRAFTAPQPYKPIYAAMQQFTDTRQPDTPDELWLLEHEPVFTQGMQGKPEHLLDPGDIPVVSTDRGGQITYHGPGQLVLYPLVDWRRRGLNARPLVTLLEQLLVDWLADQGIRGYPRPDAPGVYLAAADGSHRKLASLGLRLRRPGCYHGLAVNVAMDLSPFQRIHPCGYAGLKMTQLRDVNLTVTPLALGVALAQRLADRLTAASSASRSTTIKDHPNDE